MLQSGCSRMLCGVHPWDLRPCKDMDVDIPTGDALSCITQNHE